MIDGHKIVALCISRINDDSCHEFVTQLNRLLKMVGCRLFVYATCSDLFWMNPSEVGESFIFDLIDYDVTDAVIIFEERIKDKVSVDKIMENSRKRNIPVITIGEKFEGCFNVQFDYEKGFESVVRHVIEEHGVKDLHMIGGIKGNEFSEHRIDVFKGVISEYNIPFDDSMISYGDFWSGPTEEAMQKLIDEKRLPRAIVCANDTMAITVCNVLRRHDIRVPEDIIVTGFDGISDIEFSMPKVTSCKCHYKDLAAKCTEMIQKSIVGVQVDRHALIVPRIVRHESCGCVSKHDISAAEYLVDINDRFYRYQQENRTFTDITAKIQTCDNLEDVAQALSDPVIYDLCIILNKECTDESINPLTMQNAKSFSDEMIVLYDSDSPPPFIPKSMTKKQILPDLKRRLEQSCTIIFMPLNFLNIPLGYACFHYHKDGIANFCKIPQTVSALNNALGGFRNMRYQQYLTGQIEEMYISDALTGLYNRSGFAKKYRKLVKGLSENEQLSVILADLDGLKQINDVYGHGEGDNAIHVTAAALKHCCPDDALCMRFGGDEMLAVIKGQADEADIRTKLGAYLNNYNTGSEKPYKVSVSLGIYVTETGESLDVEELIKKADKLMYKDKAQKKKRSE